MRRGALLLVGLVWAGVAGAQVGEGAPPAPGIEERICAGFGRGRARDVAWAAWLAAEHGLPGFGADVARALAPGSPWRREAPDSPWRRAERRAESWACDHVLLDAALRLRVALSTDTLRRQAWGHRESVAVYLLARPDPDLEAVQGVFEALDPGEGPVTRAWVALGDTLAGAERLAPAFVERLLARLRVGWRLTVHSADDGATAAPPPPPAGEVPACGYVERLAPGFPPVVRHYLSLGSDARGLRMGRTRVFARRSVIEDGAWGVSSSLDGGPEPGEVVREWLGVPGLSSADVAALQPHAEWSLGWAGRQRWNRLLQPRVDAVHAAYWRLVERLVRGGALSAERARRLAPDLAVEVRDGRRDERPALPPVPPSTLPNPWREKPLPTVRDGT